MIDFRLKSIGGIHNEKNFFKPVACYHYDIFH